MLDFVSVNGVDYMNIIKPETLKGACREPLKMLCVKVTPVFCVDWAIKPAVLPVLIVVILLIVVVNDIVH